ncbi:1-acyl-sn-glycerol-3-phosphate acyltransferase [Haloechinothrix alba]|uniref:1-acyl-sn-glycerol-3-phosphate acyltransferase n=1 Tax=Haloechinothrix alba TaxID=664784 RepID=A0A238W1J1_9PSEU|nr:lysophospholipid acyltransferase family protein [Haloechinothrix alba]SNR40224.1 1-acyl-sn-glycerol-3-phosphate acyltransferase [Haloechinothrix alba]
MTDRDHVNGARLSGNGRGRRDGVAKGPLIPEQATVLRLPRPERGPAGEPDSAGDPDSHDRSRGTGTGVEPGTTTPRGGSGEHSRTGKPPRSDGAAVVRFPGAAAAEESGTHAGPDGRAETLPDGLPDALAEAVAFLANRLTGEYTVDEFGFDADLTEQVIAPALRVLYEKWFRVDVRGAEHLPERGGALLVANHSGTLPLDAAMTALAVHDNHPGDRFLRILGADLVFQIPVLGSLARKTGQTLACSSDAERLLGRGEFVGVFPEGFKGVGKPFSARYKLQRFGRGGFASAAIRAGVPIVPCAIVGAEEIYPKLGDIKPLARLLGLPYFPVTPFFPLLGPLGAVPLPTKWTIEFGEPIAVDGCASDGDPMEAFNLTDQVREAIQQMLYQRLERRRGVFGG